jgi:hypothetical protein
MMGDRPLSIALLPHLQQSRDRLNVTALRPVKRERFRGSEGRGINEYRRIAGQDGLA